MPSLLTLFRNYLPVYQLVAARKHSRLDHGFAFGAGEDFSVWSWTEWQMILWRIDCNGHGIEAPVNCLATHFTIALSSSSNSFQKGQIQWLDLVVLEVHSASRRLPFSLGRPRHV